MELLRSGLSDEGCGCPEQEWEIFNTHVTIHLEPDGTGHAFFDTGEWDSEELFNVTTMQALKEAAVQHLRSLYALQGE